MNHKSFIFIIPSFFVFAHSVAVVAMAAIVSAGLATSAESAMAWNIFLLVDFPLGWLMIPIHSYLVPLLFPKINDTFQYIIIPLVGFMILGGIQYYLLGKFLVHAILKRWPGE